MSGYFDWPDWGSQPKAIQIVAKNKDTGSFELASKAVEKLLQGDKVKDKKVCVISVAGAFRKGKSFLLNFFVKYLEKACERVDDVDNWLGSDDDKIAGFAWRGGSERATTGIWAWSKVFILKRVSEGTDVDKKESDFSTITTEEIAVVLLDSQGTFDSDSSAKECTAVFALATLISSTLVFNLSQNIQEDDLQHLQLFAEYGRLAQKQTTRTGKPFQSLMFLVRDWQYPGEYDYGVHGGGRFLAKKLSTSGRHSDLTNVRHGIQECFKRLDCCLLPYPGSKVATNRGSTGKLSDLEEEFKIEVKKFVESIASFDDLVKKKVNGRELMCGELVQFMKLYVEAFHGDDVPSATTLLQTTAKAHHETALNDAKTRFLEGIKEVCGAEVPYMDPIEIDRRLKYIKSDAEKAFKDYPKIGSRAMNEEYQRQLSNFMVETCEEYKNMNNNKTNIFIKTVAFVSYYIFYPFWSETPANKADYLVALKRAKIQFTKDVEKVCGAKVPYMDPNELDRKLEDVKSDAEKTFKDYAKVGSRAMNEEYLGTLSNFMTETCAEYKQMNGNKANIFMKTMAFISYIFYPFVTVAMFVKIQGWFHSGSMKICSFVSSTWDFITTLGSGIVTSIENSNLMPSLPDLNIKNRVLNATRTPLTLIFIMVIFNILSFVFGWFGLSQFSTSLYYVIIAAFIMLCLWIYLYFTGSNPALRQTIDEIASVIRNAGPQPAQQHVRQMVDGPDERAQGGNRRREHMD